MKTISAIFVTLIATILLIPIVFLFNGSMRTEIGFIKMPPSLIPEKINFENYELLFQFPMLRWTLNSFITTFGGMFIMMPLSFVAAYAFAKKQVPYKEIIFWMFLSMMFIPAPVLFVPSFILLKKLGLVNKLLALIVPAGLNIMMIFFCRGYIEKIPEDFLDMSSIDGCGELRKIYHVILPLSKSAIAAWAVLSFMGGWTNYISALIYLTEQSKMTLPVGIAKVIYFHAFGAGIKRAGIGMAGSVYMLLPILIVFLFFQKYFTKGIFAGGFK